MFTFSVVPGTPIVSEKVPELLSSDERIWTADRATLGDDPLRLHVSAVLVPVTSTVGLVVPKSTFTVPTRPTDVLSAESDTA